MDTNLIDSRSRLSWVCFVTPSVTPWCSRQSTLLCGIALSAASNWFWNTIISVITPYMIGEDQSQIQRLLPVGQSLQVCVCLLPCTQTNGLTLEQGPYVRRDPAHLQNGNQPQHTRKDVHRDVGITYYSESTFFIRCVHVFFSQLHLLFSESATCNNTYLLSLSRPFDIPPH